MIYLNCELSKTGRNGNPKVGRKPRFSSSLKISNAEVSVSSTGESNVYCSIKRSTTCSKILLLFRLHCQWSILRGPSATCTDVCGNETAYRSGFCVLLHLFKGVTGFTLYLTPLSRRTVVTLAWARDLRWLVNCELNMQLIYCFDCWHLYTCEKHANIKYIGLLMYKWPTAILKYIYN